MIKYIFIILFIPSIVFAEIENARDLMEAGKFKEAMEELMPAARSGNADAEELIGIMYATVALNNRPYAKDIVTVSLITALILLPITYLINYILGEPANFWYLMQKPAGASLMDAFPEPPYHLLVITPLAILMFCLVYLPYFVKDRVKS